MPSLSKTDEADLLLRVLESSTQSNGWSHVLSLIDAKLACISFLSEIEKDGSPTNEFGGNRSSQNLTELLNGSTPERSREALQFLLNEAPLLYPFCRTTLSKGEFNGSKPIAIPTPGGGTSVRDEDSRPLGSNRIPPNVPGLIAPLRRTGNSTILFGCLFPEHTTDTIDVALASETFRTLTKAIAPGLEAYYQIERERANNRIQHILLSYSSRPAVLITEERIVLGQTSSGMDGLLATGGVSVRGERLEFKNKHLEACLQRVLDAARAPNHAGNSAGTPNTVNDFAGQECSVCMDAPNGVLKRITFGAVRPDGVDVRHNQPPWIVIRMSEPSDLPEEIETVLHERFDLSSSEAHLARYLTMTGSMTDTVEQLGITRNTAKTHLRRIFEKTGVHTQLQLARLVHRLSGLFQD